MGTLALLILLPASLLQAPGRPVPPAAPEQPGDIRVFWKDGLRLETADRGVSMRLGARLQNDYAYVGNDRALEAAPLGPGPGTIGPLEDGTAFRRARLYASGSLREHLEWKAQYDFAPGVPAFTDVYLGFLDVPWGGNLRVGQFKEPFSLDQLTSAFYIPFMERSLADTFAPGRSTGAQWYGDLAQERATYAVGLFRDSNLQGGQSSDSEWQVTGRVTGLPWYGDEGRELLHLGLGVSRRSPNADTVRYRSRPESFIAPRFVDTGPLAVRDETLVGAEAALVHGRWSLQGEYILAQENALAGPDLDFSGYYVEGSVFLGRDFRPYHRADGIFGRVQPAAPLYGKAGGAGAWEAKVRYSSLDLDDLAARGGGLSDITVGVNWYLDTNFRLMLEAIQADLERADGTQIVQARFQVDW